jgi:hypothetical protein
VQQVSLFARHFNKSPEQLGPEDIRTYQVYLTNEKKLAPGSVLIAVAALRFLYKVSLKCGNSGFVVGSRRRSGLVWQNIFHAGSRVVRGDIGHPEPLAG